MGYAMMFGTCANCHLPFSFNPVKVPSVRVNGAKEPICKTCIDAANPERVKQGLPPLEYAPDAYEACEENELPL